jgi:predicted nucleic acid-binding protein
MKLLDTSVVIDIDRGNAGDRITTLDDEGRHAISTVTMTELHLGITKRYERETDEFSDALEALNRLCARFELLEVDRPVSVAAADIIATLRRRGEPLHDLHDVYIAATARTEQLPVLTANFDDFDRIDGIDVIDWRTY